MQTSTTGGADFDTIVIGVGGMGSATCFELARRGQKVLGLDRFPLGHDRGSSHGETRIIRKAYFEHPDYVPLLHRTYDLWHDLERSTNRTLFHPTGLVLSGKADGETIRGARTSANLHGLKLQNFTPAEARVRFAGLEFPDDHDVAFEPGAGTLFVETCVQTHIDEAVRLGATLQGNERVLDWLMDGQIVRVRTIEREYRSRNLVLTAGAWAGPLLSELGLQLCVLRKFVGWFPIQTNQYLAANGLPTFFYELPAGAFYGFPSFDGKTVKVAEHTSGQVVADPANVDRNSHAEDVVRLQMFIESHLPDVNRAPIRHSVCLYTMSSDQHFVIDMHPQWQNVVFAAGFSGHGFKFCPVVGMVLADLVEKRSTSLPVEFLARQRGCPQWRVPSS